MLTRFPTKILGVLSIVAGSMFGILPLMPGVFLIVLGFELLESREVAWTRVQKIFTSHKSGSINSSEYTQKEE